MLRKLVNWLVELDFNMFRLCWHVEMIYEESFPVRQLKAEEGNTPIIATITKRLWVCGKRMRWVYTHSYFQGKD
jgi:hypothetical protein